MLRKLMIIAGSVFFTAAPALADHIKVEGVEAEMMEGQAGRGDIFMRITNTGDQPDRLYAVRTAVASKATLENKSEQEVIEGQEERVTSFLVQPGETLELNEEGAHIELFGLTKQLEAGETFAATLYFEQDGPISVTVTVEEE